MFKRLIASLVCVTFIFSNLQYVHAQDFSISQLPIPGSMIGITPVYVPLTLKGMVIHPENALKFDFLMDTGYSNLKGDDLSDEALKIMKYFLTALTIPEDDLWVNLSPYEKGRIVQDNFGQTIMGRDLLAEDYILKQLTASVIYPENTLGKEFWSEIYTKASQQLGTTQIPVNTFNKVWIVPDQAVVWENEGKVIIVKSHLKVMLEADYLSASKHQIPGLNNSKQISAADAMARDTVRKLVIPVLEKEVNTGKNFAQLRQMYQAMILATWYKKALRESILNKVYANQKKTKGVDDINTGDVESIYQQYLKAFKKGAFNYIKEDLDSATGQTVPRKYFSGGFSLRNGLFTLATALLVWGATLTNVQAMDVNHALESTGTTILVKGNITDIGSGASASVIKQFEQPPQSQPAQDAAMFAIPGTVNWYIKRLGSKDEDVRKVAMRTIDGKVIAPDKKLPIFTDAMGNSNSDVRLWAMKNSDSLVTDSQKKLPILGKALRNYHEDVQLWAVREIGKIGSEQATKLLLSWSEDRHLFEKQNHNSVYPAIRNAAIGVLDQLVTDPQKKLPILEKILGSYSINAQLWAIRSLARIGGERALELVVAKVLYNYGDGDVRNAAISGVDQMVTDPQKKLSILEKALGADPIAVSSHAVCLWAMKEIDRLVTDPRKKMTLVEKFIGSKNGDVQSWARSSYTPLKVAEVMAMQDKNNLVVELGNAIPEVRKAGMNAIDNLVADPQKKLQILENALGTNDSAVHLWAMREINRLVTDPRKKMTLVEEFIGSKNGDVQSWARSSYTPLKVAEVMAMKDENKIVGELGNTMPEVRKAVMDAIDKLITDPQKQLPVYERALGSKEADVRVWAVKSLTQIKRYRIVDLILPLLHDEDKEVRNAAINGVNHLVVDPQEKLHILREALGNRKLDIRQWAINDLIQINGGIAVVASRFDDNDSKVHQAIMNAVDLVIDPEKKLPLLEMALENKEPKVRWWAMDGIKQLVIDPVKKRPLFERALESKKADVCSFAIDNLGERSSPKIVAALIRLLDTNFSYNAAAELYRIKPSNLSIEYHSEVSHQEESGYWEGYDASDGGNWWYRSSSSTVVDVPAKYSIRSVNKTWEIRADQYMLKPSEIAQDAAILGQMPPLATMKAVELAKETKPPDAAMMGESIAWSLTVVAIVGFGIASYAKWMAYNVARRKIIQMSPYEHYTEYKKAPPRGKLDFVRGLVDYILEKKPALEEKEKIKNILVVIAVAESAYGHYTLIEIMGDILRSPKRFSLSTRIVMRNTLLDINKMLTEENLKTPAGDVKKMFTRSIQKVNSALQGVDLDAAMIGRLAIKSQNKAVLTPSVTLKSHNDLGGIALDAAMLDLQIKRDGNGVPLPISQQPLDKINIQGFVPQIISIQPVDLPALLGFNFQKEEALAKA